MARPRSRSPAWRRISGAKPLWREARPRPRSALEAATARSLAGIEGLDASLETERVWLGAKADLTDAKVQTFRRSVQAFKALGGGWVSHLE